MKLGTEDKKKTIIAGVLLLGAVILGVHAFTGGDEETPTPATSTSSSAASPAKHGSAQTAHKGPYPLLARSLDPTLRFDLLKASEDVTYNGTGRDIFHSQPPVADIPKPATPDVTPQGPPPPPPPPPIDLKFYGFVGPKNGNKRIFLLKGDDIFLAKEGDIVDRRYKIMHIGASSVEVQDVLTNNTQTLPLTAG
ncbi:MAG: hypothetical protein WCC87_10115 [Candidatus Korobacteraceae bacterium]